MLGSYRLPFVVGAAASLGGGAYVGLLLPSAAAVQQRMVQETQEGKQGAQGGRQGGQKAKLAEAATSAPAAVDSNASTAASSSSSSGGAGGGGAGGDGGAGEGSSSGLVVGALPRLLLLCIYLICTCISQGFLMVAQ
jgi:hypothetical protein